MATSGNPFSKGWVLPTSLECDICQRKFENNFAYKSHLRIHGIGIKSMKGRTKNTDTTKNNKKVNKITERNKHNVVNVMLNSKQHQTKDNDVTLKKAANDDVKTESTTCGSNKSGPEYSFQSHLSQNDASHKTFYKCARCGETCKSQALLDSHKCKVVRCDKCYKPLKTLASLKQHVAEMHPKSYDYTCMICGVSFKTSLGLTNHVKSHDGKQVERQLYECSFCNLKLYTLKSFIRHKRKHTKFYQCTICKEIFDKREEQIFHSKYSHVRSRPFKCPYCMLSFSSKHIRNTHIKGIHKDLAQLSLDNTQPKYECTQCKTSFSQEYLLRNHVMKVHCKDDDTVNKIKQTDAKIMKKKNGMARVRRIDKNDGKITVRQMEGKSATMLLGHADNKSERYKCEICKASYTRRNDLKVHINEKHLDSSQSDQIKRKIMGVSGKDMVTNDTPIQSPLDTSMTNSTNLWRKQKEMNAAILREHYVANDSLTPSHVDPITGKKLYVCEICSTTYMHKDSLARHIKSRAYDHGFYLKSIKEASKAGQLKPRFECDVCYKMYARRYNMLLHRQRHTEREFKEAGVLEDLYKSPDGKTVISNLELSSAVIPSTEQEFTSSTTKTPINESSDRTDDVDVAIYMDKADDDTVEEILYTARPYFSETNEDTERVQVENMSYEGDNTRVVDGVQTERGPIRGECIVCVDENNAGQTVEIVSAEITEIREETQEGIKRSREIHAGTHVPLNTTDINNQIETTEEINRQVQHHTEENTNITSINLQNETSEGSSIPCKVHSVESLYNRSTEELNKSSAKADTNTVHHMDEHEKDNQNELPTTPEQYTNTIATLTDTLSSVSAVDDDRVCTTCRHAFRDGQKGMRCAFCDHTFCIKCSDIPIDVYNVLYGNEKECSTGILWTCNVCNNLVPKFTVLLRQLGDFEQIINNRLTDMEQKLSMMRPTVEKTDYKADFV
ncbi:zinc finger protein 845-like [Mercenaria mercenaria]|uniref:zinc finger protein 845-like n=1 Tax=Mercenaria mercenaria TaxID=6596 RepID=UPI00234F2A99|nr:zinc finger protein 845-like [Mercenaria mercenaria]